MTQKIMVTGSNGYVGCVLCQNLINAGHEVIGMDNRLFPFNFKVDGYPYEVNNLTYLTKDIRDVKEEDFDGVDVIVHLAGLSNDPIGDINDKVTRKINVYAPVEMVSIAKRAGVKKMIFSSSCSVYGFSPMESPIFFTEKSPGNPVSTYAESKLVCEGALTQLNDSNFKVHILRNATVFGPSPRMRFDLLINAMTAYAFFKNTIIFCSNPQVKRPLIHVQDLCSVISFFIRNDLKPDTYNVGRTLDNYSISDIAVLVSQAFYKRFGKDINLRYDIDDADPRSYLVNFAKLHEICGDQITHNVSEGITEMIDHFITNFSPTDKVLDEKPSFFSIKHLLYRLEIGELDDEFRVVHSEVSSA